MSIEIAEGWRGHLAVFLCGIICGALLAQYF